ncbi:MAG: MBL fold metallo-hydrolase [Cyanobacteria bacterium J06598_3]
MSASTPASTISTGNTSTKSKQPQAVFDGLESIFAFPPNRETLGGTAYLIKEQDASQQTANILVDCPALNDTNEAFIRANGGISTLFITHRGGMAQVPDFCKAFAPRQVLIQEQEAYLLPTVTTETFHRDYQISPTSRLFWTPGHSPGSACLYHTPQASEAQGGILFTGRHLLPTRQGTPEPLRLSKTFHWPRQLRYAQQLLSDFTPDTLSYICPGASTGFLRGEKKIDHAYEQLQRVNWEILSGVEAIL